MFSSSPHGVLHGVRVLEIAGLGPVSFSAMLMADMGAEVVRVSRPGHVDMERGATLRGRTQLTLDLHTPDGQKKAMELASHADILLEGFRPGVMERMKLGPDEVLSRHPKLVYGRMTGWGQIGPRASTAGHDINYIAIAGALGAIGGDDPMIPLNLVGDYGGGALYLTMGVLAALLHVRSGGSGQVVDCAICDGTVSLLSLMHGLRSAGRWQDSRASNTLDGAAPFYRTYRCSDGQFVAVGAIEPKFYRLLVERLGLDCTLFSEQHDRARWSEQAQALSSAFRQRTRAEWEDLFSDTDACVTPVNSLVESFSDPHLKARGVFIDVEGEIQPSPAPRFSNTPSRARSSNAVSIQDVLSRWSVK